MDTRFTLVCGSLVLVVALATGVIPIPHSSAVVPVIGVDAVEPQTRSEPAKTESTDVRDSPTYGEVRSGLFSRPSSPESVPVTAQTASPPQTMAVDPKLIVDPFAQVVYTGTVTIGDEKQALLENQRTKEGWYLHQGDPFMGAKIVRIDDNAVTLNLHGQMRRIPKSSVYNLVPLDAQAGSTPNRNASDPRGPGGPGGVNGVALTTFGANNSVPGSDMGKSYPYALGAAPLNYNAADTDKLNYDDVVAEKLTAERTARDLSNTIDVAPFKASISISSDSLTTPDVPRAPVKLLIESGTNDIKF